MGLIKTKRLTAEQLLMLHYRTMDFHRSLQLSLVTCYFYFKRIFIEIEKQNVNY